MNGDAITASQEVALSKIPLDSYIARLVTGDVTTQELAYFREKVRGNPDIIRQVQVIIDTASDEVQKKIGKAILTHLGAPNDSEYTL